MKRIIAVVLTLVILTSVFALDVTAAQFDKVGTSYDTTDKRCITLDEAVKAYEEEHGIKVETYRCYFYIPENSDDFFGEDIDVPSWRNEYSQDICIWYNSSMAQNAPVPESYCGYKIKRLIKNIYYADIPAGVVQYSINNGVEVEGQPAHSACSTPVLGLESADKYGKFPNHNNEIYVINNFDNDSASSTAYFSGKWYQYKGMTCYGNRKNSICLNPTHKHKSVKEAVGEYETQTGETVETNRYYFLMPSGDNGNMCNDPGCDNYGEYAESWYNDYTSEPAVYWWQEDGLFNPDIYPGYTLEYGGYDGVFYADVPQFVESVCFNNNVGFFYNEKDLGQYAYQTFSIGTQYYAPGESENYPEGTESFDNMIFVVSPDTVVVDWPLEPLYRGGEWYYYYGSGCYGVVKDGGIDDCVRDDHDHRTFDQLLKDYETQTGEKVETNRYYFLMPDGTNSEVCDDELYKNYGELPRSWYNENADRAGIYWWSSGVLAPDRWPGYQMNKGDSDSVFYIDLPTTVDTAIFNNFFDSETNWTELLYFDSAKTIMVYMLGYEQGESDLYPEGLDSFEDMIYVIKYDCDFELEPDNIWSGEWYYYYGNGCYGTINNGNIADCIRQDHKHEYLFEDKFIERYCVEDRSYDYDEIYYHYDENDDIDWCLVKADGQGLDTDDIIYLKFNDFVLNCSACVSPFSMKYGIYDAQKDEFIDLEECYTELEQYDGVLDVLRQVRESRLIGDYDCDGAITVLDATGIQRVIAKLSYRNDDYYYDKFGNQGSINDYDMDGDVTIIDATAIQRKLAKIDN